MPNSKIDEAAAALRSGLVVCFPTESSYGLAVDVRQPGSIARLVQLKGRSETAPIAFAAADLTQARGLTRLWPAAADKLARRHWPGPLTLVVPGRADLPGECVGPGGSVGVRVTSHPTAALLARALGAPITATSANPSGQPPATEVALARRYFGDAVALYLDGGSCAEPASTVVRVDEDGSTEVLRPGPVVLSEHGPD